MKRFFTLAAKIAAVCIAAALCYAAFMYAYVQQKFVPLSPLADVYNITSAPAAWDSDVLFIHAVNTPARARAKDARYRGLEIDLNRLPDGSLVAAHDATRFHQASALKDILAALKNPAEKTYWLDLKIPLTQADIDQITQTAQAFHIAKEQLFFEAPGGETARVLTKNGFPILLSLPDGFDQDDNQPARRAELNAQLAALLKEYQPAAIAGSLGKYPYLRAYFPQVNKAVYTSTTKRPSLKKTFLAQKIKQDPSVKIFMVDEYTPLPF